MGSCDPTESLQPHYGRPLSAQSAQACRTLSLYASSSELAGKSSTSFIPASLFPCNMLSMAPVADAGVRFLQLSPGEFFFTTLKVSVIDPPKTGSKLFLGVRPVISACSS
eukprot:803876-Pelagomonas_calceolata.AAC.1